MLAYINGYKVVNNILKMATESLTTKEEHIGYTFKEQYFSKELYLSVYGI